MATERQLIGGNFAVPLRTKRPPKLVIPRDRSIDPELGGLSPGTGVTNSPCNNTARSGIKTTKKDGNIFKS